MVNAVKSLLLLIILPGAIFAADPERKDAFGDPLPTGAIARLGTTRFASYQNGDLLDLAPDGSTYLQASGEKLALRDARTGLLIRELKTEGLGRPEKSSRFTLARFSADGQLIHALCDWTFSIYDVKSGKTLKSQVLQIDFTQNHNLALSDDGKRLAWATQFPHDMKVDVYDTTTGKVIFTTPLPGLHQFWMTFSADGRFLTTWGSLTPGSEEKKVATHRLWNLDSGKECTKPAMENVGVQTEIFSPDGKHVAALGWSTMTIWDRQSGQVGKQFVTGTETTRLWYSPDGKQLLVGGSAGVTRIWDVTTDERRFYRGPSVTPAAVRFLPDGRILALGGQGGSVCVWEILTGKILSPQKGHSDAVKELVFTPKDHALLSLAGDGLRKWDLTGLREERAELGRSSQEFFALPSQAADTNLPFERPRHAVPLPDGTLLQFSNRWADDCVELKEPRTDNLIRSYPAIATTLTVSSRGKILVTQSGERSSNFAAWDLATGRQLLHEPIPFANGEAIAIADASRILAVVANRRPQDVVVTPRLDKEVPSSKIVLWDLASGKEKSRFSIEEVEVSSLALTPDGRFLAASHWKGTELRNVESSTPLPPLENIIIKEEGNGWQRNGPLVFEKMLFSPDGRLLVGDSGHDHQLIVWEVASGKIRHRWQTQATTMAFSSDGQFLATGEAGGSILIWDLQPRLSGQPAAKLPADKLQTLWIDLQSPDPVQASRAMTVLRQAPEKTVTLFAEHIKPRLGKIPLDMEIAKLIHDLDSEDFEVRQKASASLTQEVRTARPALLRALADKPSLEQKGRLEEILKRFKAEFPPPTSCVPCEPWKFWSG